MKTVADLKHSANNLTDKTSKLDSLLVLICDALTRGDTEIEEIKNCTSIAWDINYEIHMGLREIAGTEDE